MIKYKNSKRPLIHIGHGVRPLKTKKLLIEFISKTKIPIMTTWNGTDIVPTNFKYFVGRPGAFAKRGANFNVQNCDFYLSIG